MAESRRILIGGLGCFLLAWAGLALDAKVDGLPLWLADGLLIFLVVGRPFGAVAAVLAAGAIGVFAAHLPQGTAIPIAVSQAAASVLAALLARWGLARLAPVAIQIGKSVV